MVERDDKEPFYREWRPRRGIDGAEAGQGLPTLSYGGEGCAVPSVLLLFLLLPVLL